jgi:hypothetical protein
MDNEIYPRNKFKKFHIGSYNAKDTGVNALKLGDSTSAAKLPASRVDVKVVETD